jgi:hypothetical protein
MKLITNTITIRDASYTISELDGKSMAAVRNRLAQADLKQETDIFIAFKCCVDPKFKSQDEVGELPNGVVTAIAKEALRLTGEEEASKKD